MKKLLQTHDSQDLDRFAASIGSALRKNEDRLPADISARLAHSRKVALAAHQIAPSAQGKLKPHVLGKWFKRSLAIAPIIAAAAGAAFMQGAVSDDGLTTSVKTDTQLLSSELPLEAYQEPGFTEFLKTYKAPAAEKSPE